MNLIQYLSTSSTIIFVSGSFDKELWEEIQLFLLSHFKTFVCWFKSLYVCLMISHKYIVCSFYLNFLKNIILFLTYNFGACLPFGNTLLLVCMVCRTKILLEADRGCSIRWVKERIFKCLMLNGYLLLLFNHKKFLQIVNISLSSTIEILNIFRNSRSWGVYISFGNDYV